MSLIPNINEKETEFKERLATLDEPITIDEWISKSIPKFNDGTLKVADFSSWDSLPTIEAKLSKDAPPEVNNMSTVPDIELTDKQVDLKIQQEETLRILTEKFQHVTRTTRCPITTKETSFAKIIPVGRKEDKKYFVDYVLPQIRGWNTFKEFILNKEALVDTIINSLKIIGSQSESIDTNFVGWEHTEWSQLGINLGEKSIIDLLQESTSIVDKFNRRSFPKESNTDKKFKRYFSITDRYSRYFEDLASELYPIDQRLQDTHANIIKYKKFFSAYLSRGEKTLAPLPNGYQKDYSVWDYTMPPSSAFTEMLHKSPALIKFCVDRTQDLVKSRIITSEIDTIKQFEELLRTMQVDMKTFSHSNKIPSSITKIRSDRFLEKILNVFLSPAFERLEYLVPSMYESDPLIMIDILLLPLFVPIYAVDDETRRQIKNYFCFTFVRNRKDINTKFKCDYYDSDIDYSLNIMTHLSRRHTDLKQLINDYFDNWSSSKSVIGVDSDIVSSEILGRASRYNYPYGKWLDSEGDSYSQISTFYRLIERLDDKDAYNFSYYKSFIKPVFDFIGLVASRREKLVTNASKITEALSLLSSTVYASPITQKLFNLHDENRFPKLPYVPRLVHTIAKGEIASYGALAQFREGLMAPLSFEHVFESQNLKGYVQELCERYVYAKEHLVANTEISYDYSMKLFTTADKLLFAFNTQEYHAPSELSSALYTEVDQQGSIGRFFPTVTINSKYLTIRTKLLKHVEQNRAKYGYTRNPVISRFSKKVTNKQGVNVIVHDKLPKIGDTTFSPKTHSFTIKQVLTDLVSMTFGKKIFTYYSNLEDIVLKMPFPITKKKFFYNPGVSLSSDLPIQVSYSDVKFSPITIYYEINEDYRYYRDWEPKVVKFPEVLPLSDEIFDDELPSKIVLSFLGTRHRLTKNVNFFGVNELFKVRSTSMLM